MTLIVGKNDTTHVDVRQHKLVSQKECVCV